MEDKKQIVEEESIVLDNEGKEIKLMEGEELIEHLNCNCPFKKVCLLFDTRRAKKLSIGGFVVPFSLIAPGSFFAPFSLIAPFSFFAPFSLFAPFSFFAPFSLISPFSFFSAGSFYTVYSFYGPTCIQLFRALTGYPA